MVISGGHVVASYHRQSRTYRHKEPAADESSKDLATADVDVARQEGHEVVGGADGVGRDVDTERDDDEADGAKRSGGAATAGAAVHPVHDDVDGVPQDIAVRDLGGGGGEDAQQADDGCAQG